MTTNNRIPSKFTLMAQKSDTPYLCITCTNFKEHIWHKLTPTGMSLNWYIKNKYFHTKYYCILGLPGLINIASNKIRQRTITFVKSKGYLPQLKTFKHWIKLEVDHINNILENQ